jgi:hypothetical protein
MGLCSYCGREGCVERDHLTGKDGCGVYFDRDLWCDACRTCNTTLAHAWRAVGLREVTIHPVATRLFRSALTLDHVASSGREVVLSSKKVSALAALHRDAALAITALTATLLLFAIALVWGSR